MPQCQNPIFEIPSLLCTTAYQQVLRKNDLLSSSVCKHSITSSSCWSILHSWHRLIIFLFVCLDTCCSYFLTIIAGVDLHFRHESELPVCRTRGLNPGHPCERRGSQATQCLWGITSLPSTPDIILLNLPHLIRLWYYYSPTPPKQILCSWSLLCVNPLNMLPALVCAVYVELPGQQ